MYFYLFFFGFFFFETLPGALTVTRTFVVGASVVVVVVVVVVVAVCFTALPDTGKVCNAMIKTAAKRINDDECIFLGRERETTVRT